MLGQISWFMMLILLGPGLFRWGVIRGFAHSSNFGQAAKSFALIDISDPSPFHFTILFFSIASAVAIFSRRKALVSPLHDETSTNLNSLNLP
jgi:hypothetical protein